MIDDNRRKIVYWHRELPPLASELVAEHTVEATSGRVPGTIAHRDELWNQCYRELMANAESRLMQEVARLRGHFAHVRDEAIDPKHDDTTAPDFDNRRHIPDGGDLVWLTFEPQAGHEQRGRRAALILSPRSYNAKARLAIGCPITSHVKGYPFEVPLPSGGKISGVVLADHVKNIDWQTRQVAFEAKAPADVVTGSARAAPCAASVVASCLWAVAGQLVASK